MAELLMKSAINRPDPRWYTASGLASSNSGLFQPAKKLKIRGSMSSVNSNNQSNWLETAKDWLAREDAVLFEVRAARLAWVTERINSDEYRLEHGGLLSKSLFEEMRYCFAYSQFIAASLVGLAYIERSLAARFYAAGRSNLQRAPLSELLNEALSHGLINQDQYEELERIRDARNVYAHFRRPGRKDGVEYRALENDDSFYGMIEQDAITIVEAALWIGAH